MDTTQELPPKQQASEAIRQAETILIVTGQHPTVDQASSVIALAQILRKFGKKVTAIISDQLPGGVTGLATGELDTSLSGALRDFIMQLDLSRAEVDKLKYTIENGKLNVHVTPFKGGFNPSDVSYNYGEYHYDLTVTLGVPTRARLDKIFQENLGRFNAIPIINIDFHRSNENYGAINLIEPYASSLCEILLALAESLQTGIVDESIATAMLTGLMASTDRFTAVHTTPKSLTVGAQLLAAGAKQQQVVRALYKESKRPASQPASRPAPARQPQTQTQKPAQSAPAQPVLKPAPAQSTSAAQPAAQSAPPDFSDQPMRVAEKLSDAEIAALYNALPPESRAPMTGYGEYPPTGQSDNYQVPEPQSDQPSGETNYDRGQINQYSPYIN